MLSEPLSEQETLDAVAQAAAEALGGDSAAVLRSAGSELELAGAYELSERLAAHLRESASALSLCARGGKVLASRRLREDDRFGDGLGDAAAGPTEARSWRFRSSSPAETGAGLVLVFFQGEHAFDDEQLELAAQVAAAARGALERSDLYERERRSRQLAQRLAQAGRELARRARSGQRPRPDGPVRRAAARWRRCLGAGARRRRGGRARGRRAGRGRSARHARPVDRLARRRHRPDARDAGDRRRRRRPASRAKPTRCSPPATRAISACR